MKCLAAPLLFLFLFVFLLLLLLLGLSLRVSVSSGEHHTCAYICMLVAIGLFSYILGLFSDILILGKVTSVCLCRLGGHRGLGVPLLGVPLCWMPRI